MDVFHWKWTGHDGSVTGVSLPLPQSIRDRQVKEALDMSEGFQRLSAILGEVSGAMLGKVRQVWVSVGFLTTPKCILYMNIFFPVIYFSKVAEGVSKMAKTQKREAGYGSGFCCRKLSFLFRKSYTVSSCRSELHQIAPTFLSAIFLSNLLYHLLFLSCINCHSRNFFDRGSLRISHRCSFLLAMF